MAKKQKKEETKVTQEGPEIQLEIPQEMQERLREESEEMQRAHGIPAPNTKAEEYEEWKRMKKAAIAAEEDLLHPAGLSQDPYFLANAAGLQEALREVSRRIEVPTPYGNLPLNFVYDSVYGDLKQNIPLLLQALLKELLYRRLMRL